MIQWEASLETGQSLIDSEHRMLVFLFRKLNEAIRTGQPDPIKRRIVEELKRYVEFHFVSEENLMRETGYPQVLMHQAQHADLLQQLDQLSNRVMGRQHSASELVSFLGHWLLDHIAHHDQHVALHVRDAVGRPLAEADYGSYLLPPAGDPRLSR
jgi:hemerythrin-like metal-binding protein